MFSISFWKTLILNFIFYSVFLFILLLIIDIPYSIIHNEKIFQKETVIEKVIYRNNFKTFEELIQDIGKKESGNNWRAQRPGSQYIGWFQFGNAAFESCKREGLDIDKFGKNDFLNDPEAQIMWFKTLMKINKENLSDIILEWNNKEIKGVKGNVTTSGILMGAHLVGHSDCRKFFESHGDYVPKDGNGVPITKYIESFSGYQIP